MAASAVQCHLGTDRIPQPSPVFSLGTSHSGLGSSLHPPALSWDVPPTSLPWSLGTAPLPFAASPGLSPKARPRGELPCEALFDPSCLCSHQAVQLTPQRGDP